MFHKDLEILVEQGGDPCKVYGCVVDCRDMVEPISGEKTFETSHYYSNPELYRPIFHEFVFLKEEEESALINSITTT